MGTNWNQLIDRILSGTATEEEQNRWSQLMETRADFRQQYHWAQWIRSQKKEDGKPKKSKPSPTQLVLWLLTIILFALLLLLIIYFFPGNPFAAPN